MDIRAPGTSLWSLSEGDRTDLQKPAQAHRISDYQACCLLRENHSPAQPRPAPLDPHQAQEWRKWGSQNPQLLSTLLRAVSHDSSPKTEHISLTKSCTYCISNLKCVCFTVTPPGTGRADSSHFTDEKTKSKKGRKKNSKACLGHSATK